ncbi:SGNH/GDSL hydrolase family protein [Amycolatopsis jiangsuensis]|uniref:Lysophospholipase L1-like esterase n=1 Tax=Amycolatopsis jiangsuensis TaxID=1181879 RepID=A0A840IWB1_9PSEU|nr:SGNH/GDSL hydrolase family protein [Amycolatopsis jiangsuensis]MBB4686876.1 lysophospholipase L1-like esterase [Amycolatopsis jiangsuensis]
MAFLRLFVLVLLAPVLVVQAVRVRRATPRLPGAAGPAKGAVGAGHPLRIAVLGESTVDGVGAPTHAEALTGQLAGLLAEAGREVRWQAVGRTGATARNVLHELVPRLQPADVLVVVLGVNDTLALHSAARFRRELLEVVVAARRRLGDVPVMLAGVPPLGSFPALPRPLQDVLGARASALDRAVRALDRLPAVTYTPFAEDLLSPELFAVDGFHPGPAGYREWARVLAEGLPAVTVRRHSGDPPHPFDQVV